MQLMEKKRYDGAVSGGRVFSLTGVLALVAGAVPALAAAATELDGALERIYREHDLQTVLPNVDIEAVAPPAGFAAPGFLWPLVAVVVVVLLAAWLATVNWERLRERRGGRSRVVAANDGGSVRARDDLAAADALAGQGWYAGAIHALLVGVLRGLADAQRWPAAATPREIAAKHMPAEDLRMLVSAAEWAHFAGRPASEADYLACRARALRLSSGAGSTPPRARPPSPSVAAD